MWRKSLQPRYGKREKCDNEPFDRESDVELMWCWLISWCIELMCQLMIVLMCALMCDELTLMTWCVMTINCVDVLMTVLMTVLLCWSVDVLMCVMLLMCDVSVSWWHCVDVLMCWRVDALMWCCEMCWCALCRCVSRCVVTIVLTCWSQGWWLCRCVDVLTCLGVVDHCIVMRWWI
jgi:hypothetical protein